jgi:hypothetical protein
MGLLDQGHAPCTCAQKLLCCSGPSMHLRPKVFFSLHIGALCASGYSETHTPVHKNTHCNPFCDLGKAPSLLKNDSMHVVICTTLSSLSI